MLEISSNKKRLDVAFIHQFLTQTYWSKGRSIEEVQKSIEHSLCFGVYLDNQQIGFARVLTDYTVFVYLMDVFISKEHRGKGYSKALMKVIMEEPRLQSCKVWMLKTRDSHGLYKQFGFTDLQSPEKLMEKIES